MFSTIMHLKHVTFNIKYNIFKINELFLIIKFTQIYSTYSLASHPDIKL